MGFSESTKKKYIMVRTAVLLSLLAAAMALPNTGKMQQPMHDLITQFWSEN